MRRATIVLGALVLLLALALASVLVTLTHLGHVTGGGQRDGQDGTHVHGGRGRAHAHGDDVVSERLDAAARFLLLPLVGTSPPLPTAANQPPPPPPPPKRAPAATSASAGEPLETDGLLVRGPRDVVQPLARAFALVPLESEAPRVVHVDYAEGPRARWAQYPEHTFVFAMHVSYPPFLMSWPHFIDEGDAREYEHKQYTQRTLGETTRLCEGERGRTDAVLRELCARRTGREFIYAEHAHTDGTVEVLANVTIKPHECGWMTTPKNVAPLEPGVRPEHDKLASFDVPEGCSFQHFFDGVLPKMVQALPLLSDDTITLVLPACGFYPMVYELLRYLGIAQSRITRPAHTSARLYYSFCDAPGWHPILWREMQRILRVDRGVPAAARRKIVYLQRNKGTHNHGRLVANEAAMLNAVRAAAPGFDVVSFEADQYPTVEATRAFFRDARVLIGPHGGAFYNLMYCGPGTVLVEFVPPQVEFFLFAQMANMLDQRHWFLTLPGSGEVNVGNVERILRLELAG